MSVESGALPSPQGEAEVKAGYGRSEDDEVSTTTANSKEADALLTSSGIDSGGVAFLYGPTLTGYRYQFLDLAMKLVPGSADRTDVFASSPSLMTYPFEFDPKATSGIIPGELMSYVVDSDQFNLLRRPRRCLPRKPVELRIRKCTGTYVCNIIPVSAVCFCLDYQG